MNKSKERSAQNRERWHRTLVVSCAMAVSVASLAAQAPSEPPPQAGKPSQFKNVAPVNKEVLKITLPRPAEADLPNGAHLMVLEDHRVPSVSFQIINTGAGGYYDPNDLPGLADTTASLMDEGTATRTSEQIAQALDTMAASVSISASEGSQIATLSGTALSDQLDDVIALAADILLHPKFADEEIARYKARTRAALQDQRGDPDFLAQERYSKAIYGDHPASSTGVTKESLEKITRDALVAFHKASYVPDYALIAVSGDITLAAARAKFEAALKEWTKSGKPRPGVTDPPPTGPMKIYIVNRPASVQTNYLLGEQAINRLNPDFDALQVMNTVLGGPNGRLFRILREEKGYTYGASSGVHVLRYRGDWRAAMDVRTDVSEASLRDLLVELGKMRDEIVPASELEDAKRSMTARFALSLESPAEVLNLYVLRQMYGYPADHWDRYSERIAAVTPAHVQAVAKKYLDPAKLQIVAVGDASKVQAGLGKIGVVALYDDEGKPLAAAPAPPSEQRLAK
jgi:zinc protease